MKKFSELAVGSFILSLVFFVPVVSGLIAVVVGVAALRALLADKENLKGEGFAIAGITIGMIQIFAVLGLSLLFNHLFFSVLRSSGDLYKIFGDWVSVKAMNENAPPEYQGASDKFLQENDFGVTAHEFMAHHDKGLDLSASGDKAASLEEHQAALEAAKKEMALSYYSIGALYVDLKDYSAALGELNKAIEYNPGLVFAYQERAALLRKMGRTEDSVAACQETISRFPDFAQAYSTLGLAYEKLGRYEEAIPAHLKAIRLNPARYFPRDRLYNCFYQVRYGMNQRALLEMLKETDAELGQEIQKKLEEGALPESDMSGDFESSLNRGGRTFYRPNRRS